MHMAKPERIDVATVAASSWRDAPACAGQHIKRGRGGDRSRRLPVNHAGSSPTMDGANPTDRRTRPMAKPERIDVATVAASSWRDAAVGANLCTERGHGGTRPALTK